MTRTMYDSVTAAHIPRTAELVAGYDTGPYAWSAADWARFRGAVHVHISTRDGQYVGHVFDVEPGAGSIAGAVAYVRARRAAGVDPTVYCNASTWPAVRAAFDRAGVAQPHYWIAKYDGHAELLAGAVAKQYANPDVHRAGHFDLSVVADHWPGIDTEDDMNKTQDNKLDFLYQAVAYGSSVKGVKYPPLLRMEVETQRRVDLSNAALKAMAELVAGGQTNLTADQVYDSVTRAIQENVVHVEVTGNLVDTDEVEASDEQEGANA